MKNQSLLFVMTAIGFVGLSGCATTAKPTLTTSQCQTANWESIGYQDGLLGRSSSYITKHREACANVTNAQTDEQIQAQWQQGREKGLQQYCTPLRAYQLGREGYAFNNVCPTEVTLDLLKAHDEGYAYYQRERAFQDFYYNDWYPFGGRFGYPYGWMNPHHFVNPAWVNPLPGYVHFDKQNDKVPTEKK